MVVGPAARQLLLGLPDAAAAAVQAMAASRTRFRLRVTLERRKDEATGALSTTTRQSSSGSSGARRPNLSRRRLGKQ